jgi:hypothetical protein
MVRIEKDKLVIELEHPSPDDFLKDLKRAIIEVIQSQAGETLDLKDIYFLNYTLLELLKGLEPTIAPKKPVLQKERKRKPSPDFPSIIASIRPDLP